MKRGNFLKSLLGLAITPFVVKNLVAEEPIISDEILKNTEKELNRWDLHFPKSSDIIEIKGKLGNGQKGIPFDNPDVALDVTRKYGKGFKATDFLKFK